MKFVLFLFYLVPFVNSLLDLSFSLDLTYEINSAFVKLINSIPNLGFKLTLNEFAHLTFKEFEEKYLGTILPDESEQGDQVTYVGSDSNANQSQSRSISSGNSQDGILVDYRKYSFPVRHQKSCGSCWAFAAISVLESRLKIINSTYNTALSEQHLVDCDTLNYGCNGGWPTNALNWIVKSSGNAVSPSSAYPYYGFRQKCRNTSKIPMKINAVAQKAFRGNEGLMKNLVANNGPVAAVVSATQLFQFYESGIFYDTTCNSNCSSVNHAVVIVGYGTDTAINADFWIVKNSWGTSWGDQGYIYMSRNRGNNCNIGCWAMYAI